MTSSNGVLGGISLFPFAPYPSSGGTSTDLCMTLGAQQAKEYTKRESSGGEALTFPPCFMPSTAELSAFGGWGPEPPMNSPPAESPASLASDAFTSPPATNVRGCKCSQSQELLASVGRREAQQWEGARWAPQQWTCCLPADGLIWTTPHSSSCICSQSAPARTRQRQPRCWWLGMSTQRSGQLCRPYLDLLARLDFSAVAGNQVVHLDTVRWHSWSPQSRSQPAELASCKAQWITCSSILFLTGLSLLQLLESGAATPQAAPGRACLQESSDSWRTPAPAQVDSGRCSEAGQSSSSLEAAAAACLC